MREFFWAEEFFEGEVCGFSKTLKLMESVCSQVTMSNSENTKVSVPVVEVESSSLASTLVDRMFEDSSDTSSKESVGTSAENFP